jgi:hypothetical protein
MSAELLLTEQVHAWVAGTAPQSTRLMDAAIARALTSYAAGASVSEAREDARRLVGCWLRHPSRRRGAKVNRLSAVS